MRYMLRSPMLQFGKVMFSHEAPADLFDVLKHHLRFPEASLTLTMSIDGSWQVWEENRGLIGHLCELVTLKDLGLLQASAKECAALIKAHGL